MADVDGDDWPAAVAADDPDDDSADITADGDGEAVRVEGNDGIPLARVGDVDDGADMWCSSDGDDMTTTSTSAGVCVGVARIGMLGSVGVVLRGTTAGPPQPSTTVALSVPGCGGSGSGDCVPDGVVDSDVECDACCRGPGIAFMGRGDVLPAPLVVWCLVAGDCTLPLAGRGDTDADGDGSALLLLPP